MNLKWLLSGQCFEFPIHQKLTYCCKAKYTESTIRPHSSKTVLFRAIFRWMKSEQTKWRGIRRGLITQIAAVKSEYILSQPHGPGFGPHKQPLCCRQHATVFNDNSQQVTPLFFFQSGLVHDYCSSWQLIDLSTVLETPISEIVRAWLCILVLFFSLKVGLGLTWFPVLASSW